MKFGEVCVEKCVIVPSNVPLSALPTNLQIIKRVILCVAHCIIIEIPGIYTNYFLINSTVTWSHGGNEPAWCMQKVPGSMTTIDKKTRYMSPTATCLRNKKVGTIFFLVIGIQSVR